MPLTLYDAAAKDAPGDLELWGHAAALRAKLVRTHTDAAENAAINGDLRRATEECARVEDRSGKPFWPNVSRDAGHERRRHIAVRPANNTNKGATVLAAAARG